MPQDELGLLQLLTNRILGKQETAPKDDVTSKIAEAIAIAKKERPDLADVEQYGPVSRLLMSRAQGYTSPAQTIYLNPDQLAGFGPQDIADTIIHEQTHVDQMKKRNSSAFGELLREALSSGESYGQRPDEMEAFQAEKERRYRMGRMQTAIPSFGNPGQYYVPMDQYLPADKRPVTTMDARISGDGKTIKQIKRKQGGER